jgi:hypothetical protein
MTYEQAKEVRSTHFIGTAEEIAIQFDKDFQGYVERMTSSNHNPALAIHISKRLLAIVAGYYGAKMCFYSNGIPTIRGIKIEEIFKDQDSETMVLTIYDTNEIKCRGYYVGAFMYKEENNENDD